MSYLYTKILDLESKIKENNDYLNILCNKSKIMYYTSIIFEGNNTSVIEAILNSLIEKNNNNLLIFSNIQNKCKCKEIADTININNHELLYSENWKFNLEQFLKLDEIKYLFFEYEDQSLEDLKFIGNLCKKYNKINIVNNIPEDIIQKLDVFDFCIDFLIIGDNKDINHIICNKELLKNATHSNSYTLNILRIWNEQKNLI